jgi:Glycosyl transferase family 21
VTGLSYVLPLRWDRVDPAGIAELAEYLRVLRELVDIIVIDGSPPEVFAAHHAAWPPLALHRPPDPAFRFANGKVNGVLTGVPAARHEHVVIADDDVRHTAESLAAIDRALDTAAVVRPQNYFAPAPWHARWDTARSLINRAMGADYPGTLGVRRSVFVAMGGYDGDVLFENLELIRTVRAAGGRERRLPGVYVRRLPPSPRRFWQQRVRQAYDEFAQPARMAAFLAVLPVTVALPARGRVTAAAAAVAVAEVGRRRAGGARVFPADTPLWAPVWLLERGVCAWLAVGARVLFGGVRYAGGRLERAASGRCRTQNSLPSGSASTVKPSSPAWPTSAGRAPSAINRSTSA